MRDAWRQWWNAMRQRRATPLVFCSACLLVAGWMHFGLGGSQTEGWWDFVRRYGADTASLQDGQWWRVFSYGLLHGHGGHLLGNVLILWLFGHRLAAWVGERPLIWIGLLALPMGALCQALPVFRGGEDLWLIGASPLAFAWAFAWMGLDPDARLLSLSFRHLVPAALLALGLLAWATAADWGGFLQAPSANRISHAAHFGGALTGYGWALWWTHRPRPNLRRLQAQRRRREGDLPS